MTTKNFMHAPSINEIVKGYFDSLEEEQKRPEINYEALYRGLASCLYLSQDSEISGLSYEAKPYYNEDTNEFLVTSWMYSQPNHLRIQFFREWYKFAQSLELLGVDFDSSVLILDSDYWADLCEQVFNLLTEDCNINDDGVYEIKNRWVEGLASIVIDEYHYQPCYVNYYTLGDDFLDY